MSFLRRFPVHHGHVVVPLDRIRKEAELAWCMDWKHTLTTQMTGEGTVGVLHVPLAEWEGHWLAGAPAPDEERPTPVT